MVSLNDLARSVAEGKDGDFGELHQRADGIVRSCVRRFEQVKDAEQDLCQEAWLRIRTSLKNGLFRSPYNFVGWAGTITRNIVLDYIDRQGYRPRTQPFPDGYDPPAPEERRDPLLAETLKLCFGHLRDEYRQLLGWIYFEGMTVPEVAVELGQTEQNVNHHRRKAMTILLHCVRRQSR